MLPAEERVTEIRPLVEQKAYFVIHAPRQVGKTTSLRSLAASLTAEGRYVAVHASCEQGHDLAGDPDWAVDSVIDAVVRETCVLPEELRPPAPSSLEPVGPHSRLINFLTAWCEGCPKPVVLFFDEIDALMDQGLVTVLRQLRAGYPSRSGRFPWSVALIGLRDVRDYKLIRSEGHDPRLGTASPFNVKVESLRLRHFDADEVRRLCAQHTEATGQVFSPAACERMFELTRGQPWLVNALARQLVEVLVPDREQAIDAEPVGRAAQSLIQRRDTHIDSLIERLREPRVERIIAPILGGELIVGDRLDDDLSYVEDLGLVDAADGHLKIANPIYQEVIPRALAGVTQKLIPHETRWYLTEDGRLDLPSLLEGFLEFWRLHGEPMLGSQPYKEVAFQLLVMSFLQRVVNGGGRIQREYALGRGRMDLVIQWPVGDGLQEEVLELKVWRDGRKDPESGAVEQLARYVTDLGLGRGALLVFDRRSSAPPFAERSALRDFDHQGCRLFVMRL